MSREEETDNFGMSRKFRVEFEENTRVVDQENFKK